MLGFPGGANQIRTGVNGFADRYLTTRTWHHFLFAIAKLGNFSETAKYFLDKMRRFQFNVARKSSSSIGVINTERGLPPILGPTMPARSS